MPPIAALKHELDDSGDANLHPAFLQGLTYAGVNEPLAGIHSPRRQPVSGNAMTPCSCLVYHQVAPMPISARMTHLA
eukprot:scaffold592430_cov36-Prasinocladus_malaysianus.AAC.1